MNVPKTLPAYAIQEYLDCGAHYCYHNVDAIQPECIDAMSLFSNALYQTISALHRSRMTGGRMTRTQFLLYFNRIWIDAAVAYRNMRFSEGTSFESLLWHGRILLDKYYIEYPFDAFSVSAVERPFSCDIDGITVRGVIDLMERDDGGNLVVSEFVLPDRSYAIGSVDKHIELVLGIIAYHDWCPDGKFFRCIDCFVEKPILRFDQWFTVQNAEEEQCAADIVRKAWDGIQGGNFTPNMSSWRCGRCGYQKQCG
jgi:hypothetical protein